MSSRSPKLNVQDILQACEDLENLVAEFIAWDRVSDEALANFEAGLDRA